MMPRDVSNVASMNSTNRSHNPYPDIYNSNEEQTWNSQKNKLENVAKNLAIVIIFEDKDATIT